jgi:hypothetical protein
MLLQGQFLFFLATTLYLFLSAYPLILQHIRIRAYALLHLFITYYSLSSSIMAGVSILRLKAYRAPSNAQQHLQ